MGNKGNWKTAGQWLAEQAVRAFFRELFRMIFNGWLS
jgi:hypothetical protein